MYTRTFIVIGAIVLLVAILGGAAFLFLGKKAPAEQATTTNNPFVFTPNTNNTQQTAQDRRIIYARDGTQVTLPDFAKGTKSTVVGQTPDDLQYDLTPYPEYVPGTPYTTHEFDIAFNQKTSEFIVTLNQEPLGHARIAAEAFLKSKLGVTDKDLCSLNVTIAVPYDVNERFADYKNLGPSTCPGAAKLP